MPDGGVKLSSLRISAEFDASKYVQGAQQKAAADKAMVASGNQVAGAVTQTEQRLTQSASAYDRLVRAIDPTAASQAKLAAGSATLQRAFDTGRISATDLATRTAQLAARYGEAAPAAEGLATAHSHVAGASGKMREAMVLTHEFIRGDWKRAIGSATIELGNFGLLGAVFNPMTLAFAGFAGVTAVAAARLVEAEQTAKRFQTTIDATRNSVVGTGSSVKEFADSLARTGPFGQSDLEDAAGALLRYRAVAADLFTTLLPLAKDYAQVTGVDVPKAAEELAKAFGGGFAGIKGLNEQYNFLTVSQLVALQRLDEQGKRTDEARIAAGAFARQISAAVPPMTTFSTALHDATNLWHDFLDSFKDTGYFEGTITDIKNIAAGLGAIADAISHIRNGAGADDMAKAAAGVRGSLRESSGFGLRTGGAGVQSSSALDGERLSAASGAAVAADQSKFTSGFGVSTGGAGALTDQATADKVADLSKSLDAEVKQLTATRDAVGKTDAETLRLKLTTEAGTAATNTDVAQRIAHVVAIQREIDALLLNKRATDQSFADAASRAAQSDRDRKDALQAGKDYINQKALQQTSIEQEIKDNNDLISALGQGTEAYKVQIEYIKIRNSLGVHTGDLVGADKDAAMDQARTIVAQQDKISAATSTSNTIAHEFTSGLSRGFQDVVTGGKSVAAAFTDIAGGIAKAIEQALIFKPLEKELTSLVDQSGGLAGVGAFLFGKNGAPVSNTVQGPTQPSGGLFGDIGDLLSGLFANGGIMTSRGPLPLNAYAGGGVANSPQLAMFGEGRTPEAYVPLPDGRSIPVAMKGGGGQGHTFNISVDARGASNPAEVDIRVRQGIAKAMPGMVAAAVNTVQRTSQRSPTFLAGKR